ncbi:helix-turn-helix domain-containing protein [Kineosporia succinea]|uniref:Plasmid maintenance system antidote protein VapI n=1 Tax=Kineosporia succinea TaxID=84632 RepID=A0ABT9P9F9_9ACTN|nr:helix-turn-helix transcriptional regulator [Kineosporia succinea]MDP9829327.1 plasmid maintenance system antidote protein VapI [Kineosporia succinea]
MGYRIREDVDPKALINERAKGRPLGPLRHQDIAERLGVATSSVTQVLGGHRDCSESFAVRLLDVLGPPYLALADVFIDGTPAPEVD